MLYTFIFQSNTQPGSYALSEIELTQMLGSDIFRDESPDTGMLDQQINRALSLALSGNGEEATELLNSLTSESYTGIQKIRIHYNLGILAYNEGDFDLSLNNFLELTEQLPESTPEYIVENTQWYISNVYLQQGQIDKAIKQLRTIASGDGSHNTRAANLLSSLTEN
jgi:tetratricopeptide (TPR) repeat protein